MEKIKKERFGFLDYAEKVRLAKLDGGAKSLLWFYASTYNWRNKQPSWYAERTICAHVGMSIGTYQSRRKYLVKHGWIKVHHKGKHNSAYVGVTVGNDDPDYENKCWAPWHPSNRTDLEEDVVWDAESGEFIVKNPQGKSFNDLVINQDVLTTYLAIFSGFIIYLATSHILPEAHSRHPSRVTLLATIAGILIMWLIIRTL